MGWLLLLSASTIGSKVVANDYPVAVKDKADKPATWVDLGKYIFFNPRFSKFGNQSCASCHNPSQAFVDSRKNRLGQTLFTSKGSDETLFGRRNSMVLTYVVFNPPFHFDQKTKQWRGGFFMDGRADTLAHQTTFPFFDPTEMALKNASQLAHKIAEDSALNRHFSHLIGKTIVANATEVLQVISRALSAFLSSPEISTRDSKYDRFLAGSYEMTDLEELGQSLFFSANRNCVLCHALQGRKTEQFEPFSDYSYHNIGVPKNPALAHTEADLGLYRNHRVNDPKQKGKFKVPSLRNVAVSAPYMHNGVFRSLHTVIAFYDKYINRQRKLNPETNQPWSEPEVGDNISPLLTQSKPFKKNFNDRQLRALVAFLKTLTDKRYEHLLAED